MKRFVRAARKRWTGQRCRGMRNAKQSHYLTFCLCVHFVRLNAYVRVNKIQTQSKRVLLTLGRAYIASSSVVVVAALLYAAGGVH